MYCVEKLGFDFEKVNVNGGVIALGYLFGVIGVRCFVILIYEMYWCGVKIGVVSMCIGSGMGMVLVVLID